MVLECPYRGQLVLPLEHLGCSLEFLVLVRPVLPSLDRLDPLDIVVLVHLELVFHLDQLE